jgi:hypothetical protein
MWRLDDPARRRTDVYLLLQQLAGTGPEAHLLPSGTTVTGNPRDTTAA